MVFFISHNLFVFCKLVLVATKMKQLQIDEVEAFSRQGLELKCAHCNNSSFVPIRLDEHNTYACPHCNKSNSIYINVTVARETTMLNSPSITTSTPGDDPITMKGSRSSE